MSKLGNMNEIADAIRNFNQKGRFDLANSTKTFYVEGKMAFPVDMLRYDACWPGDVESATAIVIGRDDPEEYTKLRRVELRSHSAPTPGRWASFGWRVVKVIP